MKFKNQELTLVVSNDAKPMVFNISISSSVLPCNSEAKINFNKNNKFIKIIFLRSKIRCVVSRRFSTILFPNALGDGERVRERDRE